MFESEKPTAVSFITVSSTGTSPVQLPPLQAYVDKVRLGTIYEANGLSGKSLPLPDPKRENASNFVH